jgi:hypothetical protein
MDQQDGAEAKPGEKQRMDEISSIKEEMKDDGPLEADPFGLASLLPPQPGTDVKYATVLFHVV